MTRDEVIRLARKASGDRSEMLFSIEEIMSFAELVAKAEREAVMQLFNQPHMEYFGQEIQEAIRNRSQHD